jgi:2-C-methyl-D-erythritol 4-phosphate cytidylyltransferase
MGADIKKELEDIDGTPVLRLAFRAFISTERFSSIYVTYPADKKREMSDALKGGVIDPIFVAGGSTRQESVFLGLLEMEELNPDYILIHDGSRPWVSPALIERVLNGTIEHEACIPVVPVTEALKQISADSSIVRHMDKKQYAAAQTPQGFRFMNILKALKTARRDGKDYSDDAEAYHQAIGPVFSVEGEPENRKITYRYDLR